MVEKTSDGHLSILRLEQIAVGERTQASTPHLAECAECRARLDALLAHEAERRARLAPAPPRRRWIGWAAAAGVLLGLGLWATRSPPPPEARPEFTARGGFVFEVHVHDGTHSRLAREGEPVEGGDRLGFRVQASTDGHLMIVGVDADDSAYLCFPQAEDWRSAPIEGGVAVTLDEAIELDDVPGDEILTAVFCEHPFEWSALPPEGAPGCIRRRLVVHKDQN